MRKALNHFFKVLTGTHEVYEYFIVASSNIKKFDENM